jgi:hypothetical protein
MCPVSTCYLLPCHLQILLCCNVERYQSLNEKSSNGSDFSSSDVSGYKDSENTADTGERHDHLNHI